MINAFETQHKGQH